MTGRSTVIALAETLRITDEALPKVRQRLVRLGCSPDIAVRKKEYVLELTFREQSMMAEPRALLKLLSGIEPPKEPAGVWGELSRGLKREHRRTGRRLLFLSGLILLSSLFLYLLVKFPGKP